MSKSTLTTAAITLALVWVAKKNATTANLLAQVGL